MDAATAKILSASPQPSPESRAALKKIANRWASPVRWVDPITKQIVDHKPADSRYRAARKEN